MPPRNSVCLLCADRLSMKAAVYGTVAGILFGLSSALTKPTLDYLHESVGTMLSHWECYAVAVAGISTFLGAILANPEQASIVGWLVSMVMAAMGGCWWPSEVMPEWLRTAAHIFPTAWAMDGFHALISFGRGFPAVALPCAALLGFGAAFSLIGAHRLRTSTN